MTSFLSSSRHNRSFSFSSSSSSSSSASFSSSSNLDSPISPFEPFGVPFQWEHRPGIRRKSHFPPKHKDPSLNLLPLPPGARSIPTHEFNSDDFFPIWKKKSQYNYVGRDPFVAALLKCSKKDGRREAADDYWKLTKSSSRAANDLFSFVDRYASCKTTCSVVDSKVFIPRSGRAVYNLSNRRFG